MDADAANLTTGAGVKVLAQFAVEGAFGGTGAITDGQQAVFSRIRFRINTALVPDTTYKITHPYGVDVVKSGPTADSPNLSSRRTSASRRARSARCSAGASARS